MDKRGGVNVEREEGVGGREGEMGRGAKEMGGGEKEREGERESSEIYLVKL